MKKKLQLILIDSSKPKESGLFTDENFYSDIPLVRLDKLEEEHFKPKQLHAVSDEEIKFTLKCLDYWKPMNAWCDEEAKNWIKQNLI